MKSRVLTTLWLFFAAVSAGTALSVPALGESEGPAAVDRAAAIIAVWADSLPFDEGAIGGIELYATERGDTSEPGYASGLAAGVRRLMFADVARQLAGFSSGEIQSFIDVRILDAGFASSVGAPPDGSLEREFERSFVRTEVLAFFENEDATAAMALDMYTDPDFRKTVSSRIERIWNEGEEVCVEMAGVKLLLDRLKYCDRVEELHGEGLAVQHSQAARNEKGEGYQTVFFKESVKTFVRLPGGLAFHYINYSRTVGMGGMKGKIGRGKIEGAEKRVVEELRRRLDARRTETVE